MQKSFENFKQKLKQRNIKVFFIGAASGIISRTLTAPMERIKIIQQSNQNYSINNSFLKNFIFILKNEGFFGLFRGNQITILKACPSMAIEYYFYDLFRRIWLSKRQLNSINSLVIGIVGGIISSTLTYPLDLMRTVLSQQKVNNNDFDGFWSSFKVIWKQFGLKGMSKGLMLNCMSYAPAVSINLTVFNLLKNKINGVKEGVDQTSLNGRWTLFLGFIGGVTSGIVIHPFDLMKKRMQIQVMNKEQQQCLREIIKEIWIQKGIKGFYLGVGTAVAKIAPATAIAQFSNQYLKEYFGVTKKIAF